MPTMPECHYVLLTVDKPVYRYDFHSNHPLILGKNPEIGLKSIFLWYTYPNVSEKCGNNKVTLKFNSLTVPITIPKGMYEISVLSKYLNNFLMSTTNFMKFLAVNMKKELYCTWV